MKVHADVLIVGAGVMGLSLAWALAKRGRRVVCFDRAEPGREASAATAGTLAVQNKPLASIPLTLLSLRMWGELKAELGQSVEFEVRGGIRIAESVDDHQRLRRSAAAQAEAGAPIEMLTKSEIASIAPYLSHRVEAASFCPLDAMSNPFLTVRALLGRCKDAGVAFLFGREVSDISIGAGGSATLVAGDIVAHADAIVIAAGAWIPRLASRVGISLPITTKVQQVLITDIGACRVPHVVTHVRGNLTLKQQSVSGKVLVGGGWAGDGDSDTGTRRLLRESIIGNARAAVNAVPGLASARFLRGWTGFEGRTPDKLPIIGALPGMRNLHVIGCASGGFTLSPAAGEVLAQQLCGEPLSVDLAPFSPARFA